MRILERLNTRSFVVLVLVGGVFYLSIIDKSVREAFADLAKIGIGGYLGQLVPRKED